MTVNTWQSWRGTYEGHYFWACVDNSIKARGTKEFFQTFPDYEDFYSMWRYRALAKGVQDAMD